MNSINRTRRRLLTALGGVTLTGLASGITRVAAGIRMRLRQQVRALKIAGAVFVRGDPGYEEQRHYSVWQALKPDRYPDLIVQAHSESDIVNTLEFARAQQLPVTVKGSGHSFVASHLRNQGIMLDVSALRDVEIDAQTASAWIGPGIRSGELAGLLAEQGLAFPVPHGVTVAMGGYLLGGGMGWNNEAWNDFGCFNVLAVEMTLADGTKVVASERERPDLFWAARGAGPVFSGVVTRFLIRVFPLPRAITACVYSFPVEALGPVIRWLEDAHERHDSRIELSLILQKKGGVAGPMSEGAISAVCFADDGAQARRLLDNLLAGMPRERRTTLNDYQPVNFDVLLSLSRILVPQRMTNETAWVSDPGVAMRELAKHMAAAPEASEIALILNMRAHRRIPDTAAYSVVSPLFVNLAAMWKEAADDARNESWMDRAIERLDPVTAGAYINESNFLRRPRRPRLYLSGPNWRRLAEIRRRYDPQDRFPSPFKLPA